MHITSNIMKRFTTKVLVKLSLCKKMKCNVLLTYVQGHIILFIDIIDILSKLECNTLESFSSRVQLKTFEISVV